MLAAPNVLLSYTFLAVVHRQYRRFGSSAWERIVRDGIQIALLMAAANLACLFCIAFEVFGLLSIMLIIVEWCVSSMLLIMYTQKNADARHACIGSDRTFDAVTSY
ncbi:hypothetical protein THASP1DRAFT_31891 [Thamnocephalis sphaerospora]|uniref:Uncharacterized protein n=1 Tax=Thamnocephalis sphaerospora TaxID=78915 RepID=A0A4P9XKF7_9FUNG|nr:hypothetical protein THASP1DRAFT_31891 [Thamnocephalis sphaerospora]|eukprot:RKP06287.1 hypothetical protein THASP1DRAFT_31891 [Thamnocephalis sphaerospora]